MCACVTQDEPCAGGMGSETGEDDDDTPEHALAQRERVAIATSLIHSRLEVCQSLYHLCQLEFHNTANLPLSVFLIRTQSCSAPSMQTAVAANAFAINTLVRSRGHSVIMPAPPHTGDQVHETSAAEADYGDD